MDPVEQRIWEERCAKEKSYCKYDKSPSELAAGRQGNELNQLRSLRSKLEGVSADYIWEVGQPEGGSANVAAEQRTTAMAELARGVPDVESAFARVNRVGATRRARLVQEPTVQPWQHSGVDPCFVAPDALDRWRNRMTTLPLPRTPDKVPRTDSTITGEHAGDVPAWRRDERPLSQWDPHERSTGLAGLKDAKQAVDQTRARAQLSKLLKVTGRTTTIGYTGITRPGRERPERSGPF